MVRPLIKYVGLIIKTAFFTHYEVDGGSGDIFLKSTSSFWSFSDGKNSTEWNNTTVAMYSNVKKTTFYAAGTCHTSES